MRGFLSNLYFKKGREGEMLGIKVTKVSLRVSGREKVKDRTCGMTITFEEGRFLSCFFRITTNKFIFEYDAPETWRGGQQSGSPFAKFLETKGGRRSNGRVATKIIPILCGRVPRRQPLLSLE